MARQQVATKTKGLPAAPRLPLAGLTPITAGAQVCQDFNLASSREWVVTNGIGGYASSTILGMNTRRTHGLLVVAAHPPVGHVVLLSKLEETLVLSPGGRFELSTNQYAGVIHPEGYRYLVEFRLDPAPTFFYRIGDLLLEKTVFLLPGENAVAIGYTLHQAANPVELIVRPLLAVRDFRWLSRENNSFKTKVEETPGALALRPYEELPPLLLQHSAEWVEHSPCWYKNFEYQEEEHEGLRVREDLWSPGKILFLLKTGESCTLVASTGRRGGTDLTFHAQLLTNTQAVTSQAIHPPGEGPLARRLSWTADSFLARANPQESYLIAGFPGFSCWGRDALISLPGLLLSTKQWDLAREVLVTLASKVKKGLLPVRLAEEDGSPEYDSADTSLWFFWSLWHYLKETRDLKFISKKLVEPCRQILEAYMEGTSFGIGMDEDGLILLSDEELPLTWMDARLPAGQVGELSEKGGIPGRALTPRCGKPVEVNALWYCALRVMAALGERLGFKKANAYERMSRLVQRNFLQTFCSRSGILYDRVTNDSVDSSIRPNMLIAAGLPFSPLPKAQGLAVLSAVEKSLLTPWGIRTLSPRDPQYRGQYIGDLKQKAYAYHQGTVWTWLIGPYVSAVLKLRGQTQAVQASIRRQILPFASHLEEGCLGSVSELFDGDPPHSPRGGSSQAWAVGEILRVINEAGLGDL